MRAEQAETDQSPAPLPEKAPGWLMKIWHAAPVRIVIGLGMLVLVQVAVSILLKLLRWLLPPLDAFILASPQVPGMPGRVAAFCLVSVGIMLSAFPAYRLFARRVERRTATELAGAGAGAELGRGVLLGAAMICLVVLMLWLSGHYRVTGINSVGVMLPLLLMSSNAAVLEELMFRAVIFRLIEQWLGSWIALAISAALFGLIHLSNPNATWFAGLAIALEAGILLGAAYMLTRRMWMVMGVHFAWNFTQGGVFGIAVSGIRLPGLLQSEVSGPAWLSGGAFGVEASVLALGVCCTAALLLLHAAYRQGRFMKPGWARASSPAQSI